MSFIEYINRQLNPTADPAMQAAMNWGLAPGFSHGVMPGVPTATGAASTAQKNPIEMLKPSQKRQAASKGRQYMPKPRPKAPSRGIPTLPNKPKQPAPQIANSPMLKPIGPAQMDNRQFAPGEEMPAAPPLNELPDMAQYFAPPMVPMYDNGQGQGVAELPPFGMNAQETGGGLPMEYAPLPDFGGGLPMEYANFPPVTTADNFPSEYELGMQKLMADEAARAGFNEAMKPYTPAPATVQDIFQRYGGNTVALNEALNKAMAPPTVHAGPVQPSPKMLQLGVGRNVSPWGIVDSSVNVKATGTKRPGYTTGKTPLPKGVDMRGMGFVGPGGRVFGQDPKQVDSRPDYAPLPVAALPMAYADTNVALGGQAEEDVDMTPMQQARHSLEDELAVLQQQESQADAEYQRMQRASAFGAMFGGRQFPQRMGANSAAYQQFKLGLAARRAALQQQYMRAQQMFDENTIANRAALGNLAVNQKRADISQGMLDVQRGQLGRQQAKDEYAKQHDAEVLQQKRDAGMLQFNMSEQDNMVKAMLNQQSNKEKAADRKSRENIASANRAAANSRAASHDQTMVNLFGKKNKASVDKDFRKQLLDFQKALAKNDKRLDVHAMLQTMTGRMDTQTAQRIAEETAALPSYKALTPDGKYRILAAAYANALTEEMGDVAEPDNDSDD